MRGSTRQLALALIVLTATALAGSVPTSAQRAAPTEEGTYQEDFASYIYKDYTEKTEWDVWAHALQVARPDGVGQSHPSIAVDAEGEIVVVWLNAHTGNWDWDLYAQRLDARGNKLWASDVQVNATSGTVGEKAAGLAVDGNGNIIVVWEDHRNDYSDIYAQKLDKNGNKLWGGDLLVNSGGETRNQVDPAVGVDGNDNVVVVWMDYHDGNIIYGQKLDPGGNKLWADGVQVSSYGWSPAIAVSADGDAVVSWVNAWDLNFDIYAQRLDKTGARQWPSEVRVNSDTGMEEQDYPAVAMDSSGKATVVWSDDRNGVPEVYGQKLGENGDKLWPGDVGIGSDSETNYQVYPRVTADGDGNAIVVWLDRRNDNDDIYSQKLDKDGNQLWVGDIRVNSDIKMAGQGWPAAGTDGNGNLVVGWRDGRNAGSDIYLQMLDGNGSLLWAKDVQANAGSGKVGQGIPAVVADPANNALVAWQDNRRGNYDIFAQKLDGYGTTTWPSDMRVNSDPGTTTQEWPDVAIDGQNNLIVVWQDWRNGDRDMYAQKLDGDGNRLWATDVRVNSDTGAADQWWTSVAGDATGNAVVVWMDARNGTRDVYAQKLSVAGDRLWEGDVRVTSQDVNAVSAAVAVDATGNAVVVWSDGRNGNYDIYGQKLSGSGNRLWMFDVRVNSDVGSAGQFSPAVAVGASGRAVVVWDDYRSDNYDTYAQKLDQSGSKVWTSDVRVDSDEGTTHQFPAAIAVDKNDYAIVSWSDARTGDHDVYVQRLDASGNKMWTTDVQVNSDLETASQSGPAISVDENGNAHVVWNDLRNKQGDIYAQRVNTVGGKAWLADLQVVYPDRFYFASGTAQSHTVDSVTDDIRQATLTAAYQANGGSVQFSLTNDGGADWADVTPGVTHVFTTAGSDLRWKAVLNADPVWNRSPIVHSLRIDYSTDLPGGDDYEPDDGCGQAQPIQVNGAVQQHSFHQQADADWTWFEADAGTTYVIQTANTGPNADTVLELHGACDQPPSASDDNAFGPGASITFEAPATGTYYVKVSQHDPAVYGEDTGYELSVRAQAPSGAAVIVAGRMNASDPLQPIISATANLAYQTFLNGGFSPDNILYLNSDPSQPGVDGPPSWENVRSGIQDWARTRVGLGIPLWVYLADHGNVDRFHNEVDQAVTAADLSLWLSNLEATSGVDQVNVIVDACHSGSFIDVQWWNDAGLEEISGHGRAVVASTTTRWYAYAPPIVAGQPVPVMYFSDGFWRALGVGQNLWNAFLAGRATVEAAAQVCGDYDYTCQRPWLDDNGDAWFDAGDGLVAQGRGLAAVFGGGVAPYIDWVEVGPVVDGRATVRAQVRDDEGIARVWARLFAPSFVPPESTDGTTSIIDVPEVELERVGGGVYQIEHDGFTEEGAYQVVIYALDDEGNSAMPRWVWTGGPKLFLPLVIKGR